MILVLATTLVGGYILVPTIFHFDKTREAAEANGQPVPWYLDLFSDKVLNLGLDLKGGIYIEMEVDILSAIKRKIDIFATDIENELKDKKIPFDSVSQPDGDGILHIRTGSAEDIEKIKSLINSDFRQTLAVIDTKMEKDMPTLLAGLNDEYKKYFGERTVEQALETIRNRIDRYGVAEPSITMMGGNRIAIELPGISDPERAINIIKKTGQLEFKIVDGSTNEKTRRPDFRFGGGIVGQAELGAIITKKREENNLPDNYTEETVRKINGLLKDKLGEGDEIAFEIERDPRTRDIIKGEPYVLKMKAEVTGDMLQNVMVSIHDNEPYVDLTLDKRGTELFAEVTKNNVGNMLAIVLDGNVMKAPTIREAIPHGRAQITLGYGGYQEVLKEAQDLTLVLQEGALPATLREATKTVVGPTLGRDSIRDGIRASLVAAIAVFLFMMIYYKLSGAFANIALVVNIILLLAILSLFQATLTLPGIAGIVLTIGMAVDANVLINERIREEIAFGRTPKAAIDKGYSNALSAIVDGNLTTLIASIILYQFGTGPVKGFAVTLSVGILTTLFTAIVITRLIFDYRVVKGKTQSISI